jgi:hypothetical protein
VTFNKRRHKEKHDSQRVGIDEGIQTNSNGRENKNRSQILQCSLEQLTA